VQRFDAQTYVTLTEAMDSHDVSRGRGAYEHVLASIRQRTLIVSIATDVLYPPSEQEELALLMPNATLQTIASPHGHDGFLIDAAIVNDAVTEWQRTPRPVRQKATSPAPSRTLAGADPR